MSLKGYEWLDVNGKVIMTFRFKDLSLDIWKDVTAEEYYKFIEYIRSNDFEPHITNQNGFKIIGLSLL